MRSILPPDRLYLGMRAINAVAFALVLTYELAYHTVIIGLNPLELVLVGVVLESMTFLFEIPTGMFADLISRRLSVILGLLLSGAGFLCELLYPTFAGVLVAQLIWGLGFTFYSGAEAAWITDELGLERAHPLFLRATQVSYIFTIIGTFLGALLAATSISVPIALGACLLVCLGAALPLVMTEAGFQPAHGAATPQVWDTVLRPLRENVRLMRTHTILWLILVLGVIIGVYVGGFDRLYTPHLLTNIPFPTWGGLPPITWLGIINGCVSLLSLVGTELIRRRYRLADQFVLMHLLVGLYSGMLVGSLLFALTNSFVLAVGGFCLSQTLRNMSRPLLLLWVNLNAPSAIRATVISTYWQANALGQVAGSPILGWLATVASIPLALSIGTAIYMTTLPVLRIAQQRWNRTQQATDSTGKP